MNNEKTKQDVWEFIQRLNRTWAVEGDADSLVNFFHRDMMAITATDRKRLEGREACVSSWRKFVESVKIKGYKELDPEIQVYGNGDFAVVTYYYELQIDVDSKNTNLSGRDMFVLVKEDGRWWVVADQFSQYPER
jgi:uncharacterized protein (TIGR02246 family)